MSLDEKLAVIRKNASTDTKGGEMYVLTVAVMRDPFTKARMAMPPVEAG